MDIGVVMTSDKGNTFTGDFGVAFGGNAKVTAVPIAALPVALYGYKFDDVNDNGIDNAEPRLANWTIQLTGTDDFGNPVNCRRLPTLMANTRLPIDPRHVYRYGGAANRLDADRGRNHRHLDQRTGGGGRQR